MAPSHQRLKSGKSESKEDDVDLNSLQSSNRRRNSRSRLERLNSPHTRTRGTAQVASRRETRQNENAAALPVQQGEENRERRSTLRSYIHMKQRVLVKMTRVCLFGPRGQTMIYALLDEGATVTVVTKEVADRVGLSGEKKGFIFLHGLRPIILRPNQSEAVTCQIMDPRGMFHSLTNVLTVPSLPMIRQSVTPSDLIHPHLFGLPIEPYLNCSPGMLIGQDNWNLITSIDIRFLDRRFPVASLTGLGWVLHGYGSPYPVVRFRWENLENLENKENIPPPEQR